MWLKTLLDEGESALRLRTDLPFFAEHCLKLRTKSGEVQPFIFNPAQLRLHALLEEQRAKTGRVRAVVLKSRQLGISSYIAARFFHRVVNNPGLRCIVIGHERQASRNLFGIIRRFYDLLPEEMRPPLDVSNQDELVFSKLDSGYLVSVASSEGTGRSATAQLLHASEVAFWDDLPQQMAGLMQTVPETPDTEVILESTPRGWNSFHSLWRKAETGESEFVPVYLPWFIDPNYRKEVGPDFQIDEEEAKLAELYGLDRGQIAWRRAKIAQLDSPGF